MMDSGDLIARRHWEIQNGKVYSGSRILRDADISTFEVLNYLYARDANRVYYSFGKIENADAPSFQALDSGASFGGTGKFLLNFESYARDKNNVFHYAYTIGKPSIVRLANLQTFRSINGRFGRDEKAAFIDHRHIKYAQIKSWALLQGLYSCDDDFCFYDNKRIVGVDRNSFICLPCSFGTWAKDKNFYYSCGNQITEERYFAELAETITHYGKIKESLSNGLL